MCLHVLGLQVDQDWGAICTFSLQWVNQGNMKSLRVHLLEHRSGGGNNLLQEGFYFFAISEWTYWLQFCSSPKLCFPKLWQIPYIPLGKHVSFVTSRTLLWASPLPGSVSQPAVLSWFKSIQVSATTFPCCELIQPHSLGSWASQNQTHTH